VTQEEADQEEEDREGTPPEEQDPLDHPPAPEEDNREATMNASWEPPPEIFNGNPADAERFLDALRQYFRLNVDVPVVRSWIRRTILALTYIQGPKVMAWTHNVGAWMDELLRDRQNMDRPVVWDQFIDEFQYQFADSQAQSRARQAIKAHKMKWPHIDQYIREFEALVRTSKFDVNHDETMGFFIEGLPLSVNKVVFIPPVPTTYQEVKDKAIAATKAAQMLDSMVSKTGGGDRPRQDRPNPFQQWRQNNQRGPNNRPPPGRYNSSNAPPRMNNMQVPMDLSRGRAPRNPGPNTQGQQRRYPPQEWN